jgi:serine-type D-Ala-D-Ala endopeptidase (penicillin-binding protein 7)
VTTLFRLFLTLLVAASVLIAAAPSASAKTTARHAKPSKSAVKSAVHSTASRVSGKTSRLTVARSKVAHRHLVASRLVDRSRVVVSLNGRHHRLATHHVVARMVTPAVPSMGTLAGLQATVDNLDLKSSVALVLDQDTNEVLFSKNSEAVLPIASITKLMTALVITDSGLPMTELLGITEEDVDTEKGSRSRLSVGTQLTREDMLHLALMSSENRAAHALGRNYPGGLPAFVNAMNHKARALGMTATHYVDPTGLSSLNQSSALDLAALVKVAYTHPLIRELSTSPGYLVDVDNRQLAFRNTNRLVNNPEWDIGLQKTGYIAAAGRCLVMQARLAGRKLIMVFLDSSGRYSRLADAERVRRWLTEAAPKVVS